MPSITPTPTRLNRRHAGSAKRGSRMIASTTTPRANGSPDQIALIVIGSVAGLLAVVLLAGGVVLLWAHETKRDASGYYATNAESVATPTYALVSDGLDIGTGGPDALFRHGRLGTIRVTATGTANHSVFVGIGRTARVESFLYSVAHDQVTDFEVDPFSIRYSRRSGDAAPVVPASLGIWAVKASSTGPQTLTWPVEKGSWAVVLMNADAARGVRAEVSVGASLPFLLWLGIGLLGGGTVLGAGAGATLRSGWR